MVRASTPSPTRRFATIAGLTLLFVGTAFAQHYQRIDLTANIPATSPSANNLDPNLVNAWGLSRSTGSPWWVADNGTGLSTIYDSNGVPQSLVVKVPPPKGAPDPSAPTGTVFNYTTSFEVKPGAPAVFLFVTEDGTISGWNPTVDLHNAIVKVSHPLGASYKGCALASTPSGPLLYATNFRTGKIDVYDGKFMPVHLPQGFEDNFVPGNYVPFGIQNVGGNIVVTYARHARGAEDEDHGPGLGYVRVFDTQGHILLRVQTGAFLNAPWGIALAPSDFGPFSHRLLIGNFGDGTISAFNAISGKFEGKLRNPNGGLLWVDGLWALSFGGNGAANGSATQLFFTAGPYDEAWGLFGKIVATDKEQRGNTE